MEDRNVASQFSRLPFQPPCPAQRAHARGPCGLRSGASAPGGRRSFGVFLRWGKGWFDTQIMGFIMGFMADLNDGELWPSWFATFLGWGEQEL